MTNHDSQPSLRCAAADWPARAMIVVWLLAVAGGWYYFEHYEFATSDAMAAAVDAWPVESSLPYDAGRPALVLFLHPKCPCSRATLAELERLLAPSQQSSEPIHVMVVATIPPTADDTWWQTATIDKARALPAANVYLDRAGAEAARFGATTSGTVMYFDQAGVRRFAGGITVTRGHEGRSAGGDAVAALVRGDSNNSPSMPVFGCRLCLPEAAPSHEVVDHTLDRSSNLTPTNTAI